MRIRRLSAAAVASALSAALLVPVAPALADDDDEGAPGWGISCRPTVSFRLSADQSRATVVVTPDTRWYSLDVGSAPDEAPPDATSPDPDPTPDPSPVPSPEPTTDTVPDVTASGFDAVAGAVSSRSLPTFRKLRCKRIDATVEVRNATTGERSSYTVTPGSTDSREFPYVLHGGQLVTATVEQGRGEDSASVRVDPTPPTRPRNVVPVDVADTTAVVDWTPPEFTGGQPVTEYRVQVDDRVYGTTPASVTAITIDGLAPATDHVVRVRARNAQGLSEPGVTTFRTKARVTVPSEPLDLDVVGTSRTSLTLRWSPPATDGGRPITGYHVVAAGRHVDVVAGTQATVGGLDPGTRYVVEVSALNEVGASRPASAAGWTDMDPVPIPDLPPTPPQRLRSVTSTHTSVSLAWQAPADQGSSPVTGYGIWVDGELWGQVPGLTAEVDGLRAGTRYTFVVRAANSEGTSRPATVRAWTLLDPVPGPTAPSVPRDAQATGLSRTEILVDWKVPVDDGGSAITGYEVRRDGAPPVTTDRTALMVTGLRPGTEYSFEIRAINDRGASPSATASAWTMMRPVPPPAAPSAPRDLAAPRATQTSVTLTWLPPKKDGGRPVSGYAVVVDETLVDTVSGTTATVTGLAPGTRYAFEVRAINDVGASSPVSLAAWTAMRPVPTPTAPTVPRGLTAVSADTTSILIDWLAPISDGGSPVLGYTVSRVGAAAVTTERTALRVAGLSAGTRYVLEVRAFNAIGTSAPVAIEAWTAMEPVPTPQRPGVPAGLAVVSSAPTSLVLDWTAPIDDGGSQVTGYEVSVDGVVHDVVPSTSASIVGLAPSTPYSVAVRAINAMGTSDPATVTARTSAAPAPAPGPAPAPAPQPITPVAAGTVVDVDGDPRTRPQTVEGAWPARTTLVSGRLTILERASRLVTNAGQDVAVAVTYRSPSVKSASVTLKARTGAYYLRVVLKKGTVSGRVVLTVLAPQRTVNGITYEDLHSSRTFIVKDSPKRR